MGFFSYKDSLVCKLPKLTVGNKKHHTNKPKQDFRDKSGPGLF